MEDNFKYFSLVRNYDSGKRLSLGQPWSLKLLRSALSDLSFSLFSVHCFKMSVLCFKTRKQEQMKDTVTSSYVFSLDRINNWRLK